MTDALSELRNEIIRTWMVLFEEPGIELTDAPLDDAVKVALEKEYQRGYDAEPAEDLLAEVERLTTDLDQAYKDNVTILTSLDKTLDKLDFANEQLEKMVTIKANNESIIMDFQELVDDLQEYAELHNIDKIVGWIDGRYSKAL